jgi:hypothetical protein
MLLREAPAMNATWHQCVELSVFWFGTTQLSSIVEFMCIKEVDARRILESGEMGSGQA